MKFLITYDQVHELIRGKVKDIQEKFIPDVILAIGGGGYIPARILRNWVDAPIIGVGVQLYGKEEKQKSGGLKKIQWLDEHAMNAMKGKRVIIVDEVDDTRTTLHYCVKELKGIASALGVFVLHNKKKEKEELHVTFYLAGEDVSANLWIVYPWEADDIKEHNQNTFK